MNVYLLPAIESGPKVVTRIMRLIPAERWDTPLDPDRFTIREVLAHLADWEPIMRSRIQQAVNEPGSTIESYDEGQMAIDNGYSTLDPLVEAEKFSRERRLTADFLRGLYADKMANIVNHQERGAQTVEDLANLLLGHDLYHIEQLTSYLE